MKKRQVKIKPGKYALIRSGFYSGSQYRGYRTKPDGYITIEKEIVIEQQFDYPGCPIVDHVPGLKSDVISDFNEKLDSGKIASGSCLHLDLHWVANLKHEIERQEVFVRATQNKIRKLKQTLKEIK